MEYEDKYVKDVYNNISSNFDNTRTYTWGWINETVNTLPKNSIICDLGCGNGRNMMNKDYNFIGVDNSKELLKICRNKGLNVIEGEMCNIPLRSNSLDALICIAAFHHLSTVERRIKALLEMKRVVKPGGKVVISVWSIEQPAKTRRTFNKYGDTIVKWDQRGKIYDRYYYIFKLDEIKELFNKVEMELESHIWDCGNEIFVLR
jgi:alkylated DNA repair protein alkB family protein 8